MKKGFIGIIIFSIIIIICSQNVLSVFTKQKENSENNSILNNDIKYNFPTLMEPIIVDNFIDDYSSLPVTVIKTPAEFSWKNYNEKIGQHLQRVKEIVVVAGYLQQQLL